MASEVIKLNIIPTGEMPVFHCSQFDNGRLINIELYRGEDAYTIPSGCTAELHCRKVDNNIVTIGSPVIDENTIKFTSTTQLTACNGKNLCEVAIMGADDYLIGSLNFWLEVEVDPLKGGINSTSEIHNLESQIEEITTEIIGENYYDKSEVDTLLADKADVSSVYTKTETDAKLALKANASSVYTKSETDTLLLTKADASDVYTKAQVETKLADKADAADVYTKTEVDTALALKANAADVYTKSQVDTALATKADASTTTAALATKADKADTYTKEQVDAIIDSLFPTKTATGPVANFTTGLTKKVVSCTVAEGATTIIHAGGNLFDKTNIVEDKLINASGIETTFTGYNISDYVPVKEGASFYLTGLTTHPNTNQDNFELFDSTKTKTGVANVKTNEQPFIIPSGVSYVKFTVADVDLDTAIFGLTANPEYTPYVEVTSYPVADKDDIVTLAGENNLFADTGNITVQYKGV